MISQGKKYKLGELEFATEQEYQDAARDLKKIKELMAKYNVADPQQAKRILAMVRQHPEAFRSPYGRKFIAKLEAAAGESAGRTADQPGRTGGTGSTGGGKAAVKEKKAKKEKKEKKDGTGKEKFQIFTVRNFVIGIIIIAAVVALSLLSPRLFSLKSGGSGGDSIKRNMVTAYAKNQADLKSQLYTYYFNVVGETEEESEKKAQEDMKNYVLDLSERAVSSMTDSEIEEAYDQLSEGGDIQNNSFVEPAAITALKEKLLASGLSNQSGNGVEGETAVTAAINSMMDYQHRIYTSLRQNYALLKYGKDECEAHAREDLEAMFGEVIFSNKMSEDEKQSYFDSFTKKGLIKDNQIVRFTTDPKAYNLPDLTPSIEVALKGEKEPKTYTSSMISYAPGASVFYEIQEGKTEGCICFRNNGESSKYIQIDEDTSVTVQGDFMMLSGSDFYSGEWFYNGQDIGLLLNGDQSSKISYVYELTY